MRTPRSSGDARHRETPITRSIPDDQESKRDPDGHQTHLRTDHLLIDLEGRAMSSGLITLFSQGAQFLLSFGSIMILARLLNPADFGLVAMLMTVMGFLRVFREAGLSTATIQREGITHAQVSNLFWMNVSVSGVIGLLLAAAAPLIAWFYREPRLVSITVILAATFPLSGLTVQHTALLSRQMRFKALAFIQVGAQLIGFAIGITMACFGYGYWALIGLNLVTVIATILLTYIAVPWRPLEIRLPVLSPSCRPSSPRRWRLSLDRDPVGRELEGL
jgi:O-antigen/teichoic acid export membrane protein